jgi:hypothetical protein
MHERLGNAVHRPVGSERTDPDPVTRSPSRNMMMIRVTGSMVAHDASRLSGIRVCVPDSEGDLS